MFEDDEEIVELSLEEIESENESEKEVKVNHIDRPDPSLRIEPASVPTVA